MPGILDMMGYIQDQGEQGRKRGLASLVGKAYNAPADQRQQILGTVAARGEPGMAYDAQSHFEKMDDTARQKLGQYAVAFDALPDDQKAQVYPQFAAQAQALGIPAPPQWNPAYAPNIQKLAQALGGGGGGDDLKSLRIGANGNYWAIRGGQFIDTGTPADPRMQLRDQPGIDPGLVNLRTGSVTPLGGAPQGQPSPQRAPGEVPFSIDPSLPPEVQAAIRANPQAGSAEGITADIAGIPQPGTGGPAAARPAIAPAQQQQLQLAQQAAQRAQEASQRAATAQELQQRGNAPTGYRFKADGSLEPIPGAPASTQPGQRLSATALRQVNSAKAKLIDLQAVKNQLALVQKKFQPLQNSFSAGPFGGGLLPTEDGKRYDAAVSLLQQFVRKLTRTPGEGSMSDWEGKLAMLANPSRNDYESVTQDKIDQLNALVNQIEQGYQSLLQDNQADITGPKQPNQANGDQPHHDPLGIL